MVFRRGCRNAGAGVGWSRPSVYRGGSRRDGVSCVSMGDSSARKRRDVVLGPGPAREELWEEEGERRGARCKGTAEVGSDMDGGRGMASSRRCSSWSSSGWPSLAGGDGGGGPMLLSHGSLRVTTWKKGSPTLWTQGVGALVACRCTVSSVTLMI